MTNKKNNLELMAKGITFKMFLFAIAIILVIIIIIFAIFPPGSKNSESETVQKITLSFKNYNYYPNTITVESGKPVEITLDSSVPGCFREFTIQRLGVFYTSSDPSEKIIFTPTKKGTYEFACGMRMGYGTINVI